ncbi:MAG: hypothetical protein R3189_03635 [Thiomicrorhabdus chilensis]|uniref:hypothetical protein n=1 Tax=Thiomicrorhabdus chilensis TaxID=63656 RepID=UPI00299F01EC|nr:hypothetical protein [Thiomicrorhabdus chilensis]MDX1347325.1 hypothetical protein [Thiomicrorhabdus chilensis]
MATETDNETLETPAHPTAEEMLERLHAVDIQQFNISEVANQLKGNKQWISILTIPVSAILLVVLTLIGTFVFDYFIASFLFSAGLVYFIAKILDQYDQQYRLKARKLVMQRIAATEGDYGLLPHFKHFLPVKYRHLWQSLPKGRYMYIDQYIQAILLLQRKLEAEKFTKIWHLNHPELAPQDEYEF